jgi:ribonucleoside-diphosphate reductase alpha chain
MQTIKTAVRMLDNVIDINFYPTKEGYNANIRHRPIGLGLMGLQDALYEQGITFDHPQAREFSTKIMEFIAYHAILSSSQLAEERGTYSSYKGSKWDRGIFPQDTLALLEQERDEPLLVKKIETLDWSVVREQVKKHGMRNSNTMAIAPTATISTIAGCFPCIEPIYKNIYVKSNMNGEFTVINKYLVQDLKKLNLWDQQMIDDLKFHDGNVKGIARIPSLIRAKYKTVFELDPKDLVAMNGERGQYLDQSQSCNVFMAGVSGKHLSDIYIVTWKSGFKSNYYLRTLAASQIEKSTLDAGQYGFTQKRENNDTQVVCSKDEKETIINESNEYDNNERIRAATVCDLLADPSCESCQ